VRLAATTGDKFEVAWEDGQNALFRIYTKDLNGVTKIRRERQEYPNKRFDDAISEKLAVTKEVRAPIAKDA
jgi:deoxyxylulose-5-phosphate synthase